MKAIQDMNIQLQDKKTDLELFVNTKETLETRLNELENNFDKTKDRCDSLECWIDIYLPLRNQHQITETVRECLTRKGKYMLGIADGLICNKLRERVFTDVGRPQLQERCLELIDRLKLDAEILTEDDKTELARVEKITQSWGDDGRPVQQTAELDVDPAAHQAESDAEMADAVFGRLVGKMDDTTNAMKEQMAA